MSKNLSNRVGEYDVLYGRGGSTNKNKGNVYFRNLILAYQPQYKQSRRVLKPRIAEMIVQIVRSRGGKFLKYDDSNDMLIEVDDEMSITKTLQALRDTVPTGQPPSYTMEEGNKSSERSRKQRKIHNGMAVREEQVQALPPNYHPNPYASQASTRIIYPNGGDPNLYTHANEKTNFTYPDAERQVNYSREYDARSLLPPPPGFQQRLPPSMTSYPTDPSTGPSFMRQPDLDARSHTRPHVGFQQQPMSNINQRQMYLPNQSQMTIPPGFHQPLLSSQHQRHSSYNSNPPSVPAVLGPSSYHSGGFLGSSSQKTMPVPPPRIQQPNPIYSNRLPHYVASSSSIGGLSSYPSGQYLEPPGGVSTSSAEFQTKIINSEPRGPSNHPFVNATGSSFSGGPQDDYRNSLINRYYPPHPSNNNNIPNVHDAAQLMQAFTHMQNLQDRDRQIQYNAEMARLAFLPPNDSSATENTEDIDHHEVEQTPSARNMDPKSSFDENCFAV